MKTAIKMIVVLTLITVISGGLLSSLDSITAPKIREFRLQELKAAIANVLPSYDYYDEIAEGQTVLYVGKKKGQDDPVGVAFRVIGNGFQGKISIMVGLEPTFNKLTGIKVLEQVETPGLGTKIVYDPSQKSDPFWFSSQFKGRVTFPFITIIKNVKPEKLTEIQAISGATITSKAVVKILNENIKRSKEIYIGKNN